MNITMTLFTTLLFVLLTPGMLTRLPPGGSKVTVALVHGLIFALLYHFTHKMVWRWSMGYEGFDTATDSCPKGKKCGTNHTCEGTQIAC